MASQTYNFSTGNFDAAERGIIGTTSLGPIVRMRMGLGLLRAIYEYRNAGIAAGDLDVGPPQRPSVLLNAMNTNTRITLAPGLTQTTLAADPNAVASLDWLSSAQDDVFCHVIAIDGTYSTGTIACPEIKTWCEALGGTYTSEL